MNFAKLISDAQQTPDGNPPQPGSLFDPPEVAPADAAVPVISDVPLPNGSVQGVPRYALEYNARRFYIGKELVAIDENMKVYEDKDESGELIAVMNLCLKGGGVIFNRKESILQGGSVVVWMEWGTPPAKKDGDKDERDYLTEKELRSPARNTERSIAADAEEDGPKEPTTNDEPDW